MEFLPKDIEQYLIAHSEAEPTHLYELNRKTHLKVLQPRMLSGHVQGRILSMLSHMIQPKRVLEIGTYTGYSAMCFAEGLASGGEIHTIDINEELEDFIRIHLEKAGLTDKIHLHFGDAADIIEKIEGSFDLVFIDADKTSYAKYYDLIIDRIPSGGYILADNVLWSGKVIDPEGIEKDPDTRAIVEFNQKIQNDDRVQNVLFPVRDGIMVIRKK